MKVWRSERRNHNLKHWSHGTAYACARRAGPYETDMFSALGTRMCTGGLSAYLHNKACALSYQSHFKTCRSHLINRIGSCQT
jgi:hypothetical protein